MNNVAYRLPTKLWLAITAVLSLFAIPQPVQAGCSDGPAAAMDWTGCSKERLMLNGMDMTAGIFENAFLSGTGFKGAMMAGANLQRSELVRSSFIGADLTGANLEKSLASRSDFSGAILRGARLVKAEFLRVSFVGADLTDADLSGGDFLRNDFTDTQMTGADLHDAIMPRAVFTGATMKGANLAGAFLLRTHFEKVDLSGVTGLEQTQLDLTCGDAATILPVGLVAPKHWLCSGE
ncbi:MAG: pentapeptide repeat-containing protein [Pseudomonadota bacterium]